ncbi:hypothetical protein ACIRQP_26145 [Streptomyces sp. NPDC102274]|uniref:hypothetical protein n=1 Tax=Streptomyces sp. NPDC102274 TaxID=3366151 RepID=UPI00380498BC
MENTSRQRPSTELALTGPVLTKARLIEGSVQRTYSAFLDHAQKCAGCRTNGVDCGEARDLRAAWRSAKELAS